MENNETRAYIVKAAGVAFMMAVALALGFWAFRLGVQSEKEWDCSDFKSRTEVEQFVGRHPEDPYDLDGDNDGQSCEDYPYTK